MRRRIAQVFDVWVGDATLPDTPRVRQARFAVRALSLIAAVWLLLFVTKRVWNTPAPSALGADPEGSDMRFGLTEAARKRLFSELVANEPEWRSKAHEHFKEAWRAEDDRAAFERDFVRDTASKRKLNVTVVYLVLDEGIRKRWPGPGGAPVEPTVIPLQQK